MTTNNDNEGYYLGDTVAVRAFYQDSDTLAAVVPSTISCTVYKPNATNTVITWSGSDTATAVKKLDEPDTGLWEFRFYFDTTLTGRHDYTIVATGNGASVRRGWFTVAAVS